MRPIPPKLRERMAADPYYKGCARADFECRGRITWEHAFTYAGKQINEFWAIIPLCEYHHLGEGLNKAVNQIIAARRATKEDRKKYPHINWAYLDKLILPKTAKQRTIQQNKALHVYFTLIANALESAGYDVQSVITKIMKIPWSPPLVKELLWKRAQKAHLDKGSTTELTTRDIDKVYDIVNRFLSEGFHITEPFPSIEEIIRRQEAEKDAQFIHF